MLTDSYFFINVATKLYADRSSKSNCVGTFIVSRTDKDLLSKIITKNSNEVQSDYETVYNLLMTL